MKKRKLDPKIIRKGDIVKIQNPEVFIRCGYPMGIEKARQEVKDQFSQEIMDLVDRVRTGESIGVLMNAQFRNREPHYKIVDVLAYEYLKGKKFGGNVREIHTQTDKRLKGKKAKVDGIKFVKTGVRVPGSGGYGYEYEYEPPYLDKEKTHKILTLSITYNDDWLENIKIDAENVTKIMSEEDYAPAYPQEMGIFESFSPA